MSGRKTKAPYENHGEVEVTMLIRGADGSRRVTIRHEGQEVYSCPSDDVVFWAMRVATLLGCDRLEQIIRRLRAIDEVRPLGMQMGPGLHNDEED